MAFRSAAAVPMPRQQKRLAGSCLAVILHSPAAYGGLYMSGEAAQHSQVVPLGTFEGVGPVSYTHLTLPTIYSV